MFDNKIMTTFKEIKNYWINDIEDTDDIELIKQYTQHYVAILEELNQLNQIHRPINDDLEIEIDEEVEENDINEDIYTLRRKLVGAEGFKEDNDKTIYIPEGIIRRQDLSHGDQIKYVKDGIAIGRDKFEKVGFIDNIEAIEPNEIESYEFAVVDYDIEHESYVCKEVYENGALKRIPKLFINDNDVEKFEIRIDDVVSIAHFPVRSIARVRWLYDTEDVSTISHAKKPTYYKEKSSSDIDKVDSKLFENLYVGIVGADTYINNYIDEVEKRGGSVKHTDSDIYKTIENMTRQSDVVVIPITQTSHAKMKIAKEVAKRLDKPFVILNNSGKNHFVHEIEKVI